MTIAIGWTFAVVAVAAIAVWLRAEYKLTLCEEMRDDLLETVELWAINELEISRDYYRDAVRAGNLEVSFLFYDDRQK